MTSVGLPDFAKPPVREVVLSVQFPSLERVTNAHIGCLWCEVFRKDFPHIEEMPPLAPVIERFEAPAPGGVRMQMNVGPPVVRYWFKNEEETELIQVQHDRFVRNWRQRPGKSEYPRYEPLRDRLCDDFGKFLTFVEEQELGQVEPNQCEVTYINDIPHGQGWERFGDVGKVVSAWSGSFTGDFLPAPEEVRFATSFAMPPGSGEPTGRLHVSVEPRYRLPEMAPLLRLSLTARGSPRGGGMDGVRGFMDLGREWVVKGFAAITTAEVHKVWERQSDR